MVISVTPHLTRDPRCGTNDPGVRPMTREFVQRNPMTLSRGSTQNIDKIRGHGGKCDSRTRSILRLLGTALLERLEDRSIYVRKNKLELLLISSKDYCFECDFHLLELSPIVRRGRKFPLPIRYTVVCYLAPDSPRTCRLLAIPFASEFYHRDRNRQEKNN